MYKLILDKTNILPNKLHEELASITEPFALLHNETEVILQFRDIRQQVETTDPEGNDLDEGFYGVYYEKRTYETPEPIEVDGEMVAQKPVEVWTPFYADRGFDTDFETILADIQAVVDAHDPNTYNVDAECNELDNQCYDSIVEGFTVDIGLGEKHFKCDLLNQSNIDNLWMNAQLVQQGYDLPEGTALEYNTSDDECLENLTVEQCLALWVAKNTHVYKYRKECELAKKAIKNA